MSARRLLPLLVASAALAGGCDTDIDVEPDGLRCDRGDVCPAGYRCVAGTCRSESADLCAGVTCQTPPAPTCSTATVLAVPAGSGSCHPTTGTCVWPTNDVTCAQGCAGGQCVGEDCSGGCAAAPAATCLDAATLRTFQAPGTCEAGACVFTQTDVTCQNGCAQGACSGQDLCAGVTCATPPAPSCSGKTRTTFAATGICSPGTGQCTYAPSVTGCAFECVQGACVLAPLSFDQVAPGVRSQVNAVDMVPGSSGNHVLAVGPKGYAAKWDGAAWTPLPTGTTKDLLSVYLRSATSGYVVGAGGIAFRYDGASLTAMLLPSASADLVAVHGKGTHVLVAGKDGRAWRSTDGVTFTVAPAPPGSHTYEMRDAFVAPDDAERMAGSCVSVTGSVPCVLYASSAAATSWLMDSPTAVPSPGFLAVGPSADTAAAFVGQAASVRRHTNGGTFSMTNVPTGLLGGAVAGFAPDGNSAAAVFVLTTRSGGTSGRLYHYVKGSGTTPLLQVFGTRQSLSRSHSGGVVVADSGPLGANIFRRGAVTAEALDLAENWVGAALLPSGRRVLTNAFADFAIREPGKATWRYELSPVSQPLFRGVLAGTTWVLGFGDAGRVYLWTPAGGYVPLLGGGTQHLAAGCRSSDTEAYLVGAGGTVVAFDGNALTQMSSGTTESLRGVFCAGAGEAFAVGQSGTVLRLSGGAWSALTPGLPGLPHLGSVWAGGGKVFVAGDNFFAAHHGSGWTVHPARGGLGNLVGRSATELYATAFKDVVRFDGAGWKTLFSAPEAMTAAASNPDRVLFTGPVGLLVEGK